jgi:branched-chain amino acid transport system substrate-binding protein
MRKGEAVKRIIVVSVALLMLLVIMNASCKKEEPPAPAPAPGPGPVEPVVRPRPEPEPEPEPEVVPEPEVAVLRVGAIIPLTGSTATYGEHTLKGIQLAFEGLNKRGDLRLELSYEDNAGDPTKSRNAVQKLIAVENVSVIIGAVQSSNTFAAAPLAQQAGYPMITPASTNVNITKEGEYISRVCYSDDFQGRVLAEFAYSNLKAGNAAIIVDAKSDYSKGLADAFTEAFEALGGTLKSKVSFVAGDTDFGAQLTQIRARNPEVVFVPAYYGDVALILRQAKDKGLDVTFIGPDGWDSPKLYEIGGDAVVGNYFTTHFSPEDRSEVVQNFVSAYKAKYDGNVPDALAALGYDAALAVYDAARRSKNLAPESIKEAINTIENLDGVTGTITLDENRNAKKDIVILETTATGAKLKTKIRAK